MAKFEQKIKAINLRKQGESIGDIAEKVGVSKSVVSLWCRNIALTKKQIENLHRKSLAGSYKGRMIFLETIRARRRAEVEQLKKEGIRDVGRLSKRDIFVGGIALYWAEGAKSSSKEEASFSNSDPRMILWMMRWFQEVLGVSDDRFRIQIRINNIHANRIKQIEAYWLRLTGLPQSQFTKTIFIKAQSKKVYSSQEYYGTVRINVKQGVRIRRKIMGFIEGLVKA